MKKTIALLLALVMVFALCACGQTNAPAVEESKAPEADATEAPATENQHFDKLTLEFVPSKDADSIIAFKRNIIADFAIHPHFAQKDPFTGPAERGCS